MSDKIQLVVRPVRRPRGNQTPEGDCFAVNGPVRFMLSVPIASRPSTGRRRGVPEKQENEPDSYVVVDFTINAVHLSEAPIKAGHTGDETYEDLMGKGDGMIGNGLEVGYVKYTKGES